MWDYEADQDHFIFALLMFFAVENVLGLVEALREECQEVEIDGDVSEILRADEL
jgi:hypothetical protein